MRHEPRPSRPRVLNLMGASAGIPSAAIQEIAWPCLAYRVTLPVRKPGKLNLFEETILRLLQVGCYDAKRLHEMTCLPLDLVGFILFRLQDNRYLDSGNQLTEEATNYLSEREEQKPEFECRVIFRELVGGRLLPILCNGNLQSEHILEWSDWKIVLDVGSTGKEEKCRLEVLRETRDTGNAAPSIPEVLHAIQRHQRLDREFSYLRRGQAVHVAANSGLIDVKGQPERYFLRCQLLVPEASTDYLIADPFGYGCSDVLQAVFVQYPRAEELVRNLKEGLIGHRTEESEPGKQAGRRVFHSSPYPELDRIKQEIKFLQWKLREDSQSVEGEIERVGFAHRLVQELFSIVEWTLRYGLEKERSDNGKVMLAEGTQETNLNLLLKIASELEIRTQSVEGLLAVRPGSIRSFDYGSTDLRVLLALTIVTARENPNHPLRRLGSAMPDWLQFIDFLKRNRDPASHGQEIRITDDFLQDAVERVGQIVSTLLPDAPSFTAGGLPQPLSGADIEYERRLSARIRIEEQIGMQNFKLLGSYVGNLLLGAEILDTQADEEKELEVGHCVKDLCSAMQAVIAKILGNFPRLEIGTQATQPLQIAEARAATAGLISASTGLPKTFATVRANGVQQALNGFPPTLGASVVAVLVRAPDAWLESIASSLPDFVSRLAILTDLRGHNQSVRMTSAEYRVIRHSTYKTIRTIMEA